MSFQLIIVDTLFEGKKKSQNTSVDELFQNFIDKKICQKLHFFVDF